MKFFSSSKLLSVINFIIDVLPLNWLGEIINERASRLGKILTMVF